MNETQRATPTAEEPSAQSGAGRPAAPIRDASGASAPSRFSAQAGSWECLRPYITDALNSRLPQPIGTFTWPIRSEFSLGSEPTPRFILQSGDRAVLQSDAGWRLFDVNSGKQIADGKLGPSDVVLDPMRRVYLFSDAFGRLAGWSLADGTKQFHANLYSTEVMYRAFFTVQGPHLLSAGWERNTEAHGPPARNFSFLEFRDLGDPMKIEGGVVRGNEQRAMVHYETPHILAALSGDRLAAAIRDRLVVASRPLTVEGEFTAEFEPLALSLDETARIHILVRTGKKTALWVIGPKGDRQVNYTIPEEEPASLVPPAIGFDHRIYLAGPQAVTCLAPDGRKLWRDAPGGPVAGIAVTLDDQLLVSAGTQLLAYDARGTRRVIRDFETQTLVTPPAMTKAGDILVASAARLYRLTPRPR